MLLNAVVKEMRLAQPEFFGYYVVCLILIVAGIYLSRRLGLTELRRIAAIDAVDEMIMSCAERGLPMFSSP